MIIFGRGENCGIIFDGTEKSLDIFLDEGKIMRTFLEKGKKCGKNFFEEENYKNFLKRGNNLWEHFGKRKKL